MPRDDEIRVRHMIDAIEAALRFAEGRRRSDLDSDEMLLFALVRAVEIVGEAAGKVSAEGRAEIPQGPWLAVIGMRNRLVHAYFDVDRDILWTTVTEAMPSLLTQLKAVNRLG
jgi:uncharacterized protein with HEPN domain